MKNQKTRLSLSRESLRNLNPKSLEVMQTPEFKKIDGGAAMTEDPYGCIMWSIEVTKFLRKLGLKIVEAEKTRPSPPPTETCQCTLGQVTCPSKGC